MTPNCAQTAGVISAKGFHRCASIRVVICLRRSASTPRHSFQIASPPSNSCFINSAGAFASASAVLKLIANPGAPNGSEKVLMIASSHLLLNHEHARIDQAFARDGGPGCLRALCQFLDPGCQPDFKIADTKPRRGAVGLAVEGLKKGRGEGPMPKLRVLH